MNRGPNTEGNVVLRQQGTELVAEILGKSTAQTARELGTEVLYMPHHATCSAKEEHGW